jgi:hypothetical protein
MTGMLHSSHTGWWTFGKFIPFHWARRARGQYWAKHAKKYPLEIHWMARLLETRYTRKNELLHGYQARKNHEEDGTIVPELRAVALKQSLYHWRKKNESSGADDAVFIECEPNPAEYDMYDWWRQQEAHDLGGSTAWKGLETKLNLVPKEHDPKDTMLQWVREQHNEYDALYHLAEKRREEDRAKARAEIWASMSAEQRPSNEDVGVVDAGDILDEDEG